MRAQGIMLGIAAALCAGAVEAQADPDLSGQLLYGVNKINGNLVRYDFETQTLTVVGKVKTSSGTELTGIKASALLPGFQKMYVLWYDSSDGKNKLVYVDTHNAVGTIVATDVEGGKFTGAATSSGSTPYGVYAIQVAKIKPPVAIAGLVNLNPNNNDDNEFKLVKDNGTSFTRDDLHINSTVDANGTYYEGPATLIHVKPKGNGNQNGLTLDGEAYALQNSNTYDFAGDMQVRVYNDNIKNSKAMGHWWIQVVSGTVTVNDEVQILTPNRITQIDQKTGTVTELMTLSKEYSGLATTDGKIFYTTNNSDLWKINTTLMTETKIGSTSITNIPDLEFIGTTIVTYNGSQQTLAPVNPATGGSAGATSNPGLGDMGTFSFTPKTQDPSLTGLSAD